MLRTRVGYAGGTTLAPTYQSIGDHSEAIEIDFDPAVLSYGELARIFLQSHNPCRSAWSRQYRSAAFPRDAEQRRVLEEAAAAYLEKSGREVLTDIEDYTGFTLAEDYHQKYRLRFVKPALAEYAELFPTTDAFLGSVAVTKANAFVGGYGKTGDLRDGLGALGLSERAQESIRKASR